MQLHGRITSVTVEPSGDSLKQDAAIGTFVLSVWDAYDFNGNGGSVAIDGNYGNLYPYSMVDYVANTITLTSPLLADYFADDVVETYPLGEVKIAMVSLGEGQEGVRAIIPFSMSAMVLDGVRNVGDQESVLIDDEEGHWTIKSIDEDIPLVGGRYVDPTDLPTGEPSTPPASSPSIEVTGLPSSLLVRMTVNAAQSSLIEYHISKTAGFTAGPTTLSTVTRDSVIVISEEHDGTPLAPDVTYYVKTRAYNVAGAAPVSAEVSGQLDLNIIETFVTNTLIAAQVIAAAIQAGDIAVGNITIDPSTGITIPQPSGGVIKFPADGTEALVQAKLIATALTAANNTILQDLVSLMGQMKLSNGIIDPTAAPTAYDYWEGHPMTGTPGAMRAICDSGSTNWIALCAFGTQYKYGRIDKTTYAWTDIGTLGPPFIWGHGLCRSAATGKYFILADSGSDAKGRITRYAASGASVGASEQVADLGLYTGTPGTKGQPCLGIDASNNLVQAVPWTDGTNSYIRMHRINPATLALISSTDVTVSAGVGIAVDLYGMNTGTFGLANTYHMFQTNSGVIAINNATNVRDVAVEFLAPSTNSGQTWDGTQFWTALAASPNPILYKHGTNAASDTIFLRYTWADVVGTGGLHETGPSPAFSYVRKARAGVVVQCSPAPQAALSGNDVANMVRIYAGSASGFASQHLQATQPAQGINGQSYLTLDLISGANPTANNWGVLGAVGSVESTNFVAGTSGWQLKGDGSVDGISPGVAAGFKSTTSDQAITAGFNTVAFTGTPDHNVGSGFTIASNIVTVVKAGVYFIQSRVSYNTPASNRRLQTRIETWPQAASDPGVGNATVIALEESPGINGHYPSMNPAGQVFLGAGAKVRVLAWTAGATDTLINSTGSVCTFNLHRIA